MRLLHRINRNGLSILELLIVITVFSALATLIFFSVSGMTERAKIVNCAAGIRQFGMAALAYRGDHSGLFPPGRLIPPLTTENQNPQTGIDIVKELRDGGYLTDLPYCPSMRLTPEGISRLKKGRGEKDRLKEMGSYALNMFLTQTRPDGLPGPYWGGHPYPGDHKMLFIAEAYYCGLTWSLSQQNFALNGADFGSLYIAPRHHGDYRLSFMFLDGHVALIAPKVTGSETYDWTDVFESSGRNGKYINARRARE